MRTVQGNPIEAAWGADAAAPVAAQPVVRPTNYARSAFHFGSAAVGFAAVTLLHSRAWIVLPPGIFALYAWTLEGARRLSPRLNDRLMRFYAPVAHPRERHHVNSATWFGTALVLLALFATRPGMIAGVAVLGVADPVAGLVGRRWGRHRIRAGRSIEGTAAFFVSGTLAAAIALACVGGGGGPSIFLLAPIAALSGALVELWSTRLDDNFTIPVAVGAVVSALTWM